LALDQFRHHSWKWTGQHLFDKILHSRYDSDVCDAFFGARAIFMVREPVGAIRSIRTLFSALGSNEYASDSETADYYEERVAAMARLWRRFPEANRIGLDYRALTDNPEQILAKISDMLKLTLPLENSYRQPRSPLARGKGDPLTSHKFGRIVGASESTTLGEAEQSLELETGRQAVLHALHDRICADFDAR